MLVCSAVFALAGNSDSAAVSETMATSMMQSCAHSAGHPNVLRRRFSRHYSAASCRSREETVAERRRSRDVHFSFESCAVSLFPMCKKRFFVATSAKR